MKYYLLVTVNEDVDENEYIIWHRKIYFDIDEAFEEAFNKTNTAVLELEQSGSFSPNEIKHWADSVANSKVTL